MAGPSYLVLTLLAMSTIAVVVGQTKPAPAKTSTPACVAIDMTKRDQKLCVQQFATVNKKQALVVPTSVTTIFQASDAACKVLKYGFADPAGSVWGGPVTRCFNGAKYVTAETWKALLCCPPTAKATSDLAKSRDTQAESGLPPGSGDLAKSRDTQAESGLPPGSAGLARSRDTAAESGLAPGAAIVP